MCERFWKPWNPLPRPCATGSQKKEQVPDHCPVSPRTGSSELVEEREWDTKLKGPVSSFLYWPCTTTSPFFSVVSSAIKWMVIPTSKSRGALKPTDIPHVRRLQWFKIDGAGLIKSYNLPLWTLPHKIIVLKSNRLSPLSPTTQVRDPGLYQSENWTVTPLLTVADLWSNQNAFISSFSSLFVNSNRPIHS